MGPHWVHWNSRTISSKQPLSARHPKLKTQKPYKWQILFKLVSNDCITRNLHLVTVSKTLGMHMTIIGLSRTIKICLDSQQNLPLEISMQALLCSKVSHSWPQIKLQTLVQLRNSRQCMQIICAVGLIAVLGVQLQRTTETTWICKDRHRQLRSYRVRKMMMITNCLFALDAAKSSSTRRSSDSTSRHVFDHHDHQRPAKIMTKHSIVSPKHQYQS